MDDELTEETGMTDINKKKSLFRFREWPVYRDAKSFRKRIRELSKRLPESERFLLRDQICRAVVEFSKYLNTSETSLEEVVCCLELIMEDGHITRGEFEEYYKESENLGAQLIAFSKRVRHEGTRL
ncbi:MAG: four helix bundle protein [Thermodesulfobacteriota bacterium]